MNDRPRHSDPLAVDLVRALWEARALLRALKGKWRPGEYYEQVPAALAIIDAALLKAGHAGYWTEG
jgi:hypothetical protein